MVQIWRLLLLGVLLAFADSAAASDRDPPSQCQTVKDTAEAEASISGLSPFALQSAITGGLLLQNRFAGDGNTACCKVCRNSQACGDNCISWSKVCTATRGCSCQQ